MVGTMVVQPCVRCLVATSLCACDIEAQARSEAREAERARHALACGFERTISHYSWCDKGMHVSVYVELKDASHRRELTRSCVLVRFEEAAFDLKIQLPGGQSPRTWNLKVPNLFSNIDPAASRYFVSKKKRVVLKLAKVENALTWTGLTKVYAVARAPQALGAEHWGLAAMTGQMQQGERTPSFLFATRPPIAAPPNHPR